MRRYAHAADAYADDWSAQQPPDPPSTRQSNALGALALPALLIWPGVLGAAFGATVGLSSGDITSNMRTGIVGGLIIGISLSAFWLLWASGLVSALLPDKGAPAAPNGPMRLTYDVQPPEQVRIVPFRGPWRLVDGVDERDLIEFVDKLPIRGHTQRAWVGYKMASGRTVDSYYWRQLCGPLRRSGILYDVDARKKGVLATSDPTEIKSHLQLGI